MMSRRWKVTKLVERLPKLRDPVLIEGLPGIGNVGKVAVDYLIDELEAEPAYEFFSYSLPHSVFVNEDNLVQLPAITLHYKRLERGNQDLLLLAGDVQPADEAGCFEFSDALLDLTIPLGLSEVITLGGIGLPTMPADPIVYVTGNSEKRIELYAREGGAEKNLFGVVGPIIGVSGLLVGLASRRDIQAVTLLAETYGHPMYLGLKGARRILSLLDARLDLGLDLKKLDEEIDEMEANHETSGSSSGSKTPLLNEKGLSALGPGMGKETNYIG